MIGQGGYPDPYYDHRVAEQGESTESPKWMTRGGFWSPWKYTEAGNRHLDWPKIMALSAGGTLVGSAIGSIASGIAGASTVGAGAGAAAGGSGAGAAGPMIGGGMTGGMSGAAGGGSGAGAGGAMNWMKIIGSALQGTGKEDQPPPKKEKPKAPPPSRRASYTPSRIGQGDASAPSSAGRIGPGPVPQGPQDVTPTMPSSMSMSAGGGYAPPEQQVPTTSQPQSYYGGRSPLMALFQ